MSDEIVNPAQPEKVEVEVSTVTALEPTLIKCQTCQKDFPRLGPNSKYCNGCAPTRKAVARTKSTDKRKANSFVYDSVTEPTKPEGLRLLEERGIKHPHVRNVVYKLLAQVAAAQGIPANRFLYANGWKAAQASYERKEAQPLEPVADEYIAGSGELLTRAEIFGLYDASVAPHEDITFENFLEIRLTCKRSCYYLGKEMFQNDFSDIHKEWSEWFPSFDSTTLPPQYTQKQAIKWMSEQSEIKDFLMLASRASFKSSWSHCWIISALCAFPDCRIALISETRQLAKDFIEKIRSYFEVMEGQETRFQRYFPEMTVPYGEGSVLSFENPMRRLRLPQSVESISMEQSVSGRRFDLGVFDDCISNVSCTNEAQIAASVMKRDLLVKLREGAGASYTLTLGTPYGINDLYFQLIERSEKNKDESFVYRIDPAFQVKKEARHKLTQILLPTLVEEDIESYLFAERLGWKFLKPDMLNAPAFFLSQNLCIFPTSEEDALRCQFDHDELWARVRPASFFGTPLGSQVWMSMDRSYSTSKHSDLSALIIGRIMPVENRPSLVVSYCHMERLKESDLLKKVLDVIATHQPTVFIAERDKNWEDFWQNVVRGCANRGIVCPYFRWIKIDNTEKSFARRVKAMELPLALGKLWFSNSFPQLEQLLLQHERFDGRKRSGAGIATKDDGVAALSLMWAECRGLHQVDEQDKEKVEERRREEEEEGARIRKAAMRAAMFGGTPYQPPPPTAEPTAPEKQRDARYKVFGSKGPWRL